MKENLPFEEKSDNSSGITTRKRGIAGGIPTRARGPPSNSSDSKPKPIAGSGQYIKKIVDYV